jgi:tetratricopeptide (TPR) repeat protein
MTPDQSTNDDSAMMDSVRELACEGRYADAWIILDRLNPAESMVQTYYGFTARKLGDFDAGMAYYTAALAIDPDNILARSYMGQGMVERGNLVGARMQLLEIRARDGRQTWSEIALRMAIKRGAGQYLLGGRTYERPVLSRFDQFRTCRAPPRNIADALNCNQRWLQAGRGDETGARARKYIHRPRVEIRSVRWAVRVCD